MVLFDDLIQQETKIRYLSLYRQQPGAQTHPSLPSHQRSSGRGGGGSGNKTGGSLKGKHNNDGGGGGRRYRPY